MNVIPSILTDDIEQAVKIASLAHENGSCEVVQIDVIDGEFVENTTLYPSEIAEINFGDLKVDFHLMTIEPIDFVREISESKKNRDGFDVRCVIGQVEKMSSQYQFIDEVKRSGMKAGLSLDLYTPVSAIDEQSFDDIKVIQVMGVSAGFGGQEFNPHAFETIKELQTKLAKLNKKNDIEIIVDGGVTYEIAQKLNDMGIKNIVVGSRLMGSVTSDDPQVEFDNNFAEFESI